jgi:hypothetical protein
MLKAEGFARLPRRRDEERPEHAHPEAAAVADVRALDLRPRSLRTRFGGFGSIHQRRRRPTQHEKSTLAH